MRMALFLLWFLSDKGRPGSQPTMTYQVAVRLGTSPLIESRLGNPIRGKGSKSRQESETAPANTVRSPTRTPSFTAVLHMQRVGQSHAGSWFSLCESLRAQVGWFCGFSCGVLDPSGSYDLSTHSSVDSSSSTWCLAVGLCICFHRLLNDPSVMTLQLGTNLWV